MNRDARPMLAVLVVVTLAIMSAPVAAQPSDASRSAADTPEAEATTESQASERAASVEWLDSWHKTRWWQYALSPSLVGFGFTARFGLDAPDVNWEEPFGFEQPVLDAIAVREDPARENLRWVNDLSFYGAMGYRIFDSAIVPWFLHDAREVSWQMSWIDLQSFGLVAGLLWGTQIFVGRLRPTARYCDEPDRTGHLCDEDNPEYARSFIAGHTATALTAAGLTCTHHARMPLYGGGLVDDLACGVMLTNATFNAVTRLMVELHYPTDLALGIGLGLVAGWVLPRALHYGWGDDRPPSAASSASSVRMSFSPTVIDRRPAMMLLGRF